MSLHSDNTKNSKKHSRQGSTFRKKRVVLLFFLATVFLFALIYRIFPAFHQKSDSDDLADSLFQYNAAGGIADAANNGGSGPLSGKTVLLDPGHGGVDVGAIFPLESEFPDFIESEAALQIANRVKKHLENMGATVVMLRTDDSFVGLYKRAALVHLFSLDYVKDHGILPFSEDIEKSLRTSLEATVQKNTDSLSDDPDCMGIMAGTGVSNDLALLMEMEKQIDDVIFVSIHINANYDFSLRGSTVYYVTDESIANSPTEVSPEPEYLQFSTYILRDPYSGRNGEKNQALAQSIYDSILKNTPSFESNNSYTVEADNFAVIREHNLPGVLVETGYITNDYDRTALFQRNTQESIAESIAKGCLRYFDEISK